jgi:ligand-binding sensor domain-containing protein
VGPRLATFGAVVSVAPEKGWARYRDFVPEDIAVDAAGVMWLATERGAYAWDLASGRSAMVSPLADWYNNVNLAPDGSVWFASMPDGHLARLQGTAWRSWSAFDGMPSSHIFATAFAPNGDLWVTTRSTGVARFDGQSWTTYQKGDGLATDLDSSLLFGPDGTLWIGSRDETPGAGLSRFDGKSWQAYTVADGMLGPTVSPLGVAPDGAIWFGTIGKGGISRFDGRSWTNYRKSDGLAADDADSMAVAPDGTLWFGSSTGISSFAGGRWTAYMPEAGGLPVRNVRAIAFTPDGAMWLACAGEGLVRYQK